ncbi:MAG: glycoside hydrolase family 27 protein [Lachnospiraceae bacterium]|nr:glycoside hydrolase family 27 protein [Lachnospiraceae bacterium]
MLAKTPPMGWNSWNTFGPNINETVVMEMTDLMVEKGYRDAGYEYVVIDDCWALRERNEKGELVPDPEKFPHGMKYLADYIHSKGMKFGMYSAAGVRTCAGYPGSYGHEYEDAAMFASWGVDYLKYDKCHFAGSADARNAYVTMSMALRATGRDIVFSGCTVGENNPHDWMRSAGAHLYRSTVDIFDSPESFRNNFTQQYDKFSQSGPGCFNDIDMLIVGMRGTGNVARIGGCSDEAYKMHFALWCFWGAPLMLGADLRKLDDFCHELLTNKELIRLNQDPECRPPYIDERQRYHNLNKRLAAIKMLDNNEFALGLFNYSDDAELEVLAYFDDLGIPSGKGIGLELTDIFTGETITKFDFYTPKLPAMTCKIYRAKIVKR